MNPRGGTLRAEDSETNPSSEEWRIEACSCYTVTPMRKCLAIVLLVFLPLQFSWAAVASYCQHETGAAAKHFGHHAHQHKAADGKDASPDPAKTLGGDPDCASCHAGCFSVLSGEIKLASSISPSLDTAYHPESLAAPPPERLERPRWRALA